MDDGRREKKRKDPSKHSKEMGDRRDELRIFILLISFPTFYPFLSVLSAAILFLPPLLRYIPHD